MCCMSDIDPDQPLLCSLICGYIFCSGLSVGIVRVNRYLYEGVSINNQPILFPMDRNGHDFHALFQYMFYTRVQNCTRIESFFNKILNVTHG